MTTQAAKVPDSGTTFTATFARHCADLLYVEQAIPSQGGVAHVFALGRGTLDENGAVRAGAQSQASKVVGSAVFRANQICFIWNLVDADPSLPPVFELEYGAPELCWSHFGGEDTGVYASLPTNGAPGQWQGLVVRRWYVPWEDLTRAAIFVHSPAQSTWTHCLTAAMPGANLKLIGTTCTDILKPFQGDASSVEGVCSRHFRMHAGQGWERPSNQLETKPEQANARALVTHVEATPSEGELTVRWTTLASAPPQLGARIWIEDKDRRVLATARERAPNIREHTMSLHGLSGNYRAHVVVEDIFDQDSNDAYAGFVC